LTTLDHHDLPILEASMSKSWMRTTLRLPFHRTRADAEAPPGTLALRLFKPQLAASLAISLPRHHSAYPYTRAPSP
jgi:hypothetical protein